MKVLQISSARSIGGGEKHVVDVSNELSKRGHGIFAAVVPGSPLKRFLSDLPAGHIGEFPLRNALDVASAMRVAEFVRANGIELINAHFAKDYPVAAIAARVTNVPYVITRHVLFPMKRLHRFVLRQVRFVIAPSNAVADSLRRYGLFPDEKIITIRYGLDVDNFPIRNTDTPSDVSVGSIGNLDPVKGFDVFIRAAGLVSKDRPDVRFKIVGEDRSRDRRNEIELRALITELDLADSVELAGWSDDIAGALSAFTLFVSASRSESFGFVIAEAMLSGVPVVATDTDGAKEIISDPTLGILVPNGDSSRLANAIIELLSDNDRRTELSSFGRRHITEHFSLKKTVDETEALYRRAIESP